MNSASGSCAALAVVLVFAAGCQEDGLSAERDAAARLANGVAADYVDGYYKQFPEESYEVGYPDTPLDRLGDRSRTAMAAWEAQEDVWLAELKAVDVSLLEGSDAAVPHAFATWRLQASVDRRVCRIDLWNVSPTFSGWQAIIPATLSQQPVGTDKARADALARAADIARYVDTEIDNLREGIVQGYTAPRSNVKAVLVQIDAILASKPEDSPFYDPAKRDDSDEFKRDYREILTTVVYPAVRRYRTFLADEYRPRAREAIGVSSDPGGTACYAALVMYNTSLPLEPQEIHENGHRQMERIQSEVREIGRRSFGIEEPKKLFQLVRADPKYTFRTGEEVLSYARAAVERGKSAVPQWFGFVPKAAVVVRPFPDFMKRSGGGFYSAGSADGTRPGTYELGIHEPHKISKAGIEATAFHEAYPGHHMQVSVGLEREGLHPVLKYFFFSGTGEGWALYTERLADEMGIYTSDLDRVGMLSNEAFRAARLVVDPGMHVLGWSRQQAIDYMLANTAESRGSIESEVDRYIATPAQATAYLTGSLEIQRLRRMAEEHMGARFDIKEFHDKVIEDGTVTLGMLQRKIEAWVGQSPS